MNGDRNGLVRGLRGNSGCLRSLGLEKESSRGSSSGMSPNNIGLESYSTCWEEFPVFSPVELFGLGVRINKCNVI